MPRRHVAVANVSAAAPDRLGARGEIERQEQAAVFDQEGVQLAEAAPLVVGNHHA
jgi:hypothetical protein